MVRPFASRKDIYPAKFAENIKDEKVLEFTSSLSKLCPRKEEEEGCFALTNVRKHKMDAFKENISYNRI